VKEEVVEVGESFDEERSAGQCCSEYNEVQYVEIGDGCTNCS
jgi:hypothetical protein